MRLPRRAEEELRASVEVGKSAVVAGLAVQTVLRYASFPQREALHGPSLITTHMSEWKTTVIE